MSETVGDGSAEPSDASGLRNVSVNQEVGTSDVVDVRPLPPKPDDKLRYLMVICLFSLVLAALIVVVIGLGTHWFNDDFGKTILQTVVSPVLGALAAVVGYLFAERKHTS
ncbi:MAG TPA: hypothetical protein VGN81_16020 [Pseudonocardiaceae bacterium]